MGSTDLFGKSIKDEEREDVVKTVVAAGVLRPPAKDHQDTVVRYVYISLPPELMPRQAEQVRQLLGKLTRVNDVILYNPESDLFTLIGFAERYGLFALPYTPEHTNAVPEHHIVVLAAHSIDSSLQQLYDINAAKRSGASHLICRVG